MATEITIECSDLTNNPFITRQEEPPLVSVRLRLIDRIAYSIGLETRRYQEWSARSEKRLEDSYSRVKTELEKCLNDPRYI